ncbi:hypothetical protein TRFO_11562 [Tritrichomonas foetus]|uniref:Uncharacterized protein n=1 Tax=Tritrichomonas foetus TaxID=1144522 RepID=A0A1J4J2W4_9EUKA|nr:hypothetical protein TRFO_11562 [Tritrichomonas foetus]|eukprot:OHS93766.1 hypothetical protein TRFO_11562 [Tritrichomonas foetus]
MNQATSMSSDFVPILKNTEGEPSGAQSGRRPSFQPTRIHSDSHQNSVKRSQSANVAIELIQYDVSLERASVMGNRGDFDEGYDKSDYINPSTRNQGHFYNHQRQVHIYKDSPSGTRGGSSKGNRGGRGGRKDGEIKRRNSHDSGRKNFHNNNWSPKNHNNNTNNNTTNNNNNNSSNNHVGNPMRESSRDNIKEAKDFIPTRLNNQPKQDPPPKTE